MLTFFFGWSPGSESGASRADQVPRTEPVSSGDDGNGGKGLPGCCFGTGHCSKCFQAPRNIFFSLSVRKLRYQEEKPQARGHHQQGGDFAEGASRPGPMFPAPLSTVGAQTFPGHVPTCVASVWGRSGAMRILIPRAQDQWVVSCSGALGLKDL